MRHLNKNKQNLFYALHIASETIYKLDEHGNKIVSYVDETTTPPTVYYEDIGQTETYDEPVEFEGNIALSGGDSQEVEFGVSVADYEAILSVGKDLLPIDETSLIWHTSEPTIDTYGHADASTADYRVIKKTSSLNTDRYILKKVVK